MRWSGRSRSETREKCTFSITIIGVVWGKSKLSSHPTWIRMTAPFWKASKRRLNKLKCEGHGRLAMPQGRKALSRCGPNHHSAHVVPLGVFDLAEERRTKRAKIAM